MSQLSPTAKKILVPIAKGTEEMEAITIMDIMVRAGYHLTTASVDSEGELVVTGSRGIPLTASCKLVDVADEEFDAILLPGGLEGAMHFRDSTLLTETLRQQIYDGRLIGAICAAPAIVLQHHDFYPKALMTAHPSFQNDIPKSNWRSKRVTYDINHNLLTSQGPGSALEFAMEVIILLSGKAHAAVVAEPMAILPNLQYDRL
ncbi:DJ-1/PfpI family protein [Vibrio sp.]|nr:DJ-1/PfpI family protein [Vibrio sp.]